MDRRTFLKLSAVATGAATGTALTGPAFSAALALEPGPFQYGVASGDPLTDRLMIWTRVTPGPAATPGSGLGAPTAVEWVVATDPGLTSVVRSGMVTTSPDSDHTVKVDVDRLAPATRYFYGFRAAGQSSTVGNGRTAPAAGADVARLRFGFVSCSNFTGGFFTPYRYLAQRNDLDFVLHDGDYIYEYGNGADRYGPSSLVGVRDHDPALEVLSLSDYRRRYASYKADPDLQALHAKAAWITTIDDHEVANDTHRTGAQNHQPATEGDFGLRRAAGLQAYLEWMPIRPAAPAGADGVPVLYRKFRFGTLADLAMLDLRSYRDAQVGAAEAGGADRTMTGPEQARFITGYLDDRAPSRWRLFGNSVQLMPVGYPAGFSPAPDGTFRNTDAWDGYTVQQQALLREVQAAGDRFDAVFLTGDIHSTWAADLPLDTKTYTGVSTLVNPSVATEFVCTSVTSDNLNEILKMPPRGPASLGFEAGVRTRNPHVKLLEFDSHGYCVVDVTADRVQCDWFYVSERTDPNASQAAAFSYQTLHGSKTVGSVNPTGAPAPVVDDSGPAPVIPEAPVAVALPLVAAAVGGAALYARRRRDGEIEGSATLAP